MIVREEAAPVQWHHAAEHTTSTGLQQPGKAPAAPPQRVQVRLPQVGLQRLRVAAGPAALDSAAAVGAARQQGGVTLQVCTPHLWGRCRERDFVVVCIRLPRHTWRRPVPMLQQLLLLMRWPVETQQQLCFRELL